MGTKSVSLHYDTRDDINALLDYIEKNGTMQGYHGKISGANAENWMNQWKAAGVDVTNPEALNKQLLATESYWNQNPKKKGRKLLNSLSEEFRRFNKTAGLVVPVLGAAGVLGNLGSVGTLLNKAYGSKSIINSGGNKFVNAALNSGIKAAIQGNDPLQAGLMGAVNANLPDKLKGAVGAATGTPNKAGALIGALSLLAAPSGGGQQQTQYQQMAPQQQAEFATDMNSLLSQFTDDELVKEFGFSRQELTKALSDDGIKISKPEKQVNQNQNLTTATAQTAGVTPVAAQPKIGDKTSTMNGGYTFIGNGQWKHDGTGKIKTSDQVGWKPPAQAAAPATIPPIQSASTSNPVTAPAQPTTKVVDGRTYTFDSKSGRWNAPASGRNPAASLTSFQLGIDEPKPTAQSDNPKLNVNSSNWKDNLALPAAPVTNPVTANTGTPTKTIVSQTTNDAGKTTIKYSDGSVSIKNSGKPNVAPPVNTLPPLPAAPTPPKAQVKQETPQSHINAGNFDQGIGRNIAPNSPDKMTNQGMLAQTNPALESYIKNNIDPAQQDAFRKLPLAEQNKFLQFKPATAAAAPTPVAPKQFESLPNQNPENPLANAASVFDAMMSRVPQMSMNTDEVNKRAQAYNTNLDPILAKAQQDYDDSQRAINARFGTSKGLSGALIRQLQDEASRHATNQAAVKANYLNQNIDRARQDLGQDIGVNEGRFNSGLGSTQANINLQSQVLQQERSRASDIAQNQSQRDWQSNENLNQRNWTAAQAQAEREYAKSIADQQAKANLIGGFATPLINNLVDQIFPQKKDPYMQDLQQQQLDLYKNQSDYWKKSLEGLQTGGVQNQPLNQTASNNGYFNGNTSAFGDYVFDPNAAKKQKPNDWQGWG